MATTEKKYLDIAGLGTLVTEIKNADAATLKSAKDYTDEKIGTLESAATTVASAIAAEKTRAEAAEGKLDTAVKAAQKTADDITTKVGEVPANVGETATSTVVAYIDAKTAAASGDASKVAKDLSDYQTANDAAVSQNATAIAAINNTETGILKTAKDYTDALASGAVAANTTAIAAINNTETGILKQAKDYTDALKDGQVATNKSDISAINTKIGTVTEGKTVVQMIADAQTAATYDDTAVKADIKKNADAIEVIQGEGEGSIKKAVADTVTEIVAGADKDFDTLKEVADWILSDSTGAAKMQADISKLMGGETVDGSVAKALKDAKTYADGLDSAMDTRVDALEAAIGENGSVATQIQTAIEKLDAEKTQTAGADGLALSITEVDGKITAISGSIAANTYDAHGAAAAVQGETTETVASVAAKVDAFAAITAKEITDLFGTTPQA